MATEEVPLEEVPLAQDTAHKSVPHGYGPSNPHPLSKMRAELVWEGKYDVYGNRRGVDFAGSTMPMQRIETIDEPRSRAEAQGGLFDSAQAHLDDFRNLLVWGDWRDPGGSVRCL